MRKEYVMGNGAIALGALAAGVNLVAGYPGTPSSEIIENIAKYENRSERNRVDREKMIQKCKNPIVEDDFHGFLHRNCEGTEQLQRFNKRHDVRSHIRRSSHYPCENTDKAP